MMDEKSLGQRLQAARRAAGMTQQTLCQKANISYSTLAKIERGAIKSPSIFTIQHIAAALGTSLDNLMDIKPAKPPLPPGRGRSKNGIEFVYFDVNGCLVHFFQRAFVALARETGISSDVIETYYWQYNDAVCGGDMTIDQFNDAFAKCLHVASIDWLDYYVGAVQPVPGMDEVVRWVSEHYRIGLLTNIMPGFLDELRDRALVPDLNYNEIIDSSVVRAIKPEQKIFDIAAAHAGVAPNKILLVDDDRTNLMVADKRGWHVLWCDDYHPEETAERIKQVLELTDAES